MHKLILDELPEEFVRHLQPSFEDLPHTAHKDGAFRLRRYSVAGAYGDKLENTEFTQSSDFNKYQGDATRKFDPIEDHVFFSEGFTHAVNLFRNIADLHHEEVEAHQMRISTHEKAVPVSPEGVHQDGFDAVGIFSINRVNVLGGEALLFSDKVGYPFFSQSLEPGVFVIIDDRELWHSAKAIVPVNKEEPAHMDAFILTGRRDSV